MQFENWILGTLVNGAKRKKERFMHPFPGAPREEGWEWWWWGGGLEDFIQNRTRAITQGAIRRRTGELPGGSRRRGVGGDFSKASPVRERKEDVEFIQKEEGGSHLPADSYSDPGILCPSLSRVVMHVSVSLILYFDIYLVSRSFYLSPFLQPPPSSLLHTRDAAQR